MSVSVVIARPPVGRSAARQRGVRRDTAAGGGGEQRTRGEGSEFVATSAAKNLHVLGFLVSRNANEANCCCCPLRSTMAAAAALLGTDGRAPQSLSAGNDCVPRRRKHTIESSVRTSSADRCTRCGSSSSREREKPQTNGM